MGYSKKRIDRHGRARYTTCYLAARGSLRSAGTFTSKKEAGKAWQAAETRLGEGRLNDPRRGRQTFRRYVTGGADLQTVKDRLGHGSISTTEKYLHTLPDADDAALDAFSRIRSRSGTGPKHGRGRSA